MEAVFHWGSWLHLSSGFAATAVSTLVSATWEGAVLACGVLLCLRLFPGLNAAARSVVWMNVFLLLVLLHFVPAMGAHGTAGFAARPAALQLDQKWSLSIAGVWVGLSLLRAALLIASAVRSLGLARRAAPVAVVDTLRALLQIRTAHGKARRSAELCTSSEVERPSVFGFFHPRILLPPALMARLTAEELRQVVIHEMEHLRRGDDWTNLAQKLALVLFPLNPALLWVERRLCAERELACDDSVLRSTCGRKAYAICLTRLAEYSMVCRSLSLVLGAWERQSELVRRVHRILRRPSEGMSGRQAAALTACLMAGVLAGGAVLARSPRLVSFVPGAPATAQARVLPDSDFRPMNLLQTGVSAQRVKAVMTPAALPSTSAAKPVRKNAAMRRAARPAIEQQQTWLVMTEWSDGEAAPQLVFTVERGIRVSPNQAHWQEPDRFQQNQPRYAALPLPNGWLIVEI
ncbi:MAG: M56 family metallopeptidase [Terracidiphilus sp.]|nr:M56 family metallopeptidase [Terracidiphilus sp.]